MTQNIERFSSSEAAVSESSHLPTSQELYFQKRMGFSEFFLDLLEKYSHPAQIAYINVLIRLKSLILMRSHNQAIPEELCHELIVECNVAEQTLKKQVFNHFREQRRNISRLFEPAKSGSEKYVEDEEINPFFILKLRLMIHFVRMFFGESGVSAYRQQINKQLEDATYHHDRIVVMEEILKVLTKLRHALTDSETRTAHYTLIWSSLSRHLVDLDLPSDLSDDISKILCQL